MFETCFLHIGTEKTGTKSIQGFMRRNTDRLIARGVLYPQSLGPLNHRKLRNFAASTHEHLMGVEVREHPGGVAGFRAEVIAGFGHEVASTPCRSLVVSDEHFHSALTALEELERLRAFLHPHCRDIRIVVYLRRQDELCRSFYSEYIKTGRIGDAPLTGDSTEYYYDYRALIENYEAVFGRGNVQVRRYESRHLVGADAIDDFARVIGLGDVRDWPRPGRQNPSLSALALQFLAELNRHVPQAVDGRLNPDRTDLRAVLEAHFVGTGWPVSRRWAREFYARYRAGNEWVRQRFFPDSATLFDDDFSQYPDTVAVEPPVFADAVAVAAVLWRHQAEALRTMQAESARLLAQVAHLEDRAAGMDQPPAGRVPRL